MYIFLTIIKLINLFTNVNHFINSSTNVALAKRKAVVCVHLTKNLNK